MQDRLHDWSFVSVDLELTNRCESRCTLCPREAIARPIGTMDTERFQRIAEILGECRSLVSVSGMGDPLSHPHVFDFCRDLRRRGADVSIVVNAALLSGQDTMAELVASGPNSILLSFASSRREVFEQVCPNASYERSLEAARFLIRLARNRVGLTVSGIRTLANQDEQDPFVRFWEAEGALAEMRPCHGRGGNLACPELYAPGERGLTSGCCGLLSFHTFVTWQGDVLACCHDLTGETRMGNLVDQGREEISLRKVARLRTGVPFDLCSRCDEPLRTCGVPDGLPPADRKARRRFFRKLKSGSG